MTEQALASSDVDTEIRTDHIRPGVATAVSAHASTDVPTDARSSAHADPAAHLRIIEENAIQSVTVVAPSADLEVAPEVPFVEAPLTAAPARARSSSMHAWTRRYVRALVGLDAVVGLIAVLVVTYWAPGADVFTQTKVGVLALGAAAAWPLAVMFCRGYDHADVGVGSDEFNAVLHAGIFAIAAGAVPSAVTHSYGLVALTVTAVPLAFALSGLVRLAARRRLHHQQRRGQNLRRTLLVGRTPSVAELAALVRDDAQTGMTVSGVCVPLEEVDTASRLDLPVLGDVTQVRELVLAHGIDAVAVGGADTAWRTQLRQLAWSLEGLEVELLVHPGLVEVAGPRMHLRPYVGLPLLQVEQPHFTGWRRAVKRAFDIVLTSLVLLAASPFFLVIALGIKLNDGGPVFFRQKRVGQNGSTFTMLKFRSMYADAEDRLADLRAKHPEIGVMFKMTDDPRVTRIGKLLRMFSLDELPQLLNVLAGTMSLVGPRPPLPVEVDGYASDARRRLLVTPGLTGLWQVSGRSLLSWEETVRLDLRYVENWTLSFDLQILWKTAFAVLARRGAY